MKQKNRPFASVIIPTYNRAKILQYTLDAIVNQTESKNNFEVIVVDDGSKDETAEVVKSFQDKLDLKYFWQEDEGYRVGSARNIGIENAKGELCIFIDSGVIAGTNCIREHMNMHANSEVPVAVIGYVYGFDQNNLHGEEIKRLINVNDTDATIRMIQGQPHLLDLRENFYRKHHDSLEKIMAPWVLFWTCNVSAPKKMLETVGMFDPEFDGNWGVEDLELGYKLFKAGCPFLLNRNADSIHFPHDKDEEKKIISELINKRYFNKKYKSIETGLFLNCDWDNLNHLLEEAYAKHDKQKVVSPLISQTL